MVWLKSVAVQEGYEKLAEAIEYGEGERLNRFTKRRSNEMSTRF